MSADRRPFLDAIRAAPEDDLPRLVYADWLGGRGDTDRAEYVRAAVAAERLPSDDPARDAPARRANELVERHKDEWFGEIGYHYTCPTRGFMRAATSTVEPFVTADGALADAEPLEFVTLILERDGEDGAALVRRLAECPYLDRFASLFLMGPWAGRLPALLRSPYLDGLRGLSLSNLTPTPEDVAAVAEPPRSAGLTGLDWDGGGGRAVRVETDLARALAASPHIGALKRLTLGAVVGRPDSLAVLAAGPNFDRLEHLSLGGRRPRRRPGVGPAPGPRPPPLAQAQPE